MTIATIFSVVLLLASISGAILAIVAIWHARTTQGAVAWGIALVAAPIVSVPMFLVLGRRKFSGYVNKHRESNLTDKDAMERLAAIRVHENDMPENFIASMRVFEGLADMPFLRGNSPKLLADGPVALSSMLAAIDGAMEAIMMQTYIIEDDATGRQFRDALIAAKLRGVDVWFLYDEVGSKRAKPSFFEPMHVAGILPAAFGTPLNRSNRLQVNFRNHRKILIVDHKMGFTGGNNIGDEYNGHAEKFGGWRDTHIQLEGPVVAELVVSFREDYLFATGCSIPFDFIDEPNQKGVPAMILPTGPADDFEGAGLMFMEAILRARKRLWIATPYFVPESDITHALDLAVLRGVDVRIIIPEVADHRFLWLAHFAFMPAALTSGVRVWRYQEGFMHQKTILVDDELSLVGSANFDNRSIRLNFEATALVYDRVFAAQMAAMFENDFTRSTEFTLADYHAKPIWLKAAAKVARLAGPVL